ncbi:glycosyltransferase family 2 protein [Candidatus Peregrinibacteria bacterium]|nr:glycosyltransferase family 2 protein [Candidatus Peregrinibacteria bacterium]
MPKVSVLIPTYKPDPRHLRETLQSLLTQTEQDFECILCDEPTKTDTKAIIAEYLRDKRFRYVRNSALLGIGGNWNQSLTHATAPVIAFLFQDDLWERDYLETGLKIFAANPGVGFVSQNHRYRYDDNLHTIEGYEVLQNIKREVLKPGLWKGSDFLKFWLQRNMHPNLIGEPPFVMLRREVMEEVGPFTETMPQFLDVEYWLRCLLVTDWYYADGLHGTFRVHGEAASYRNNASGEGLYDRLRCFEWLIGKFDGDMRRFVIASRNRAVEDMAKKFLMRVKRRQGVSANGSKQVLWFVLKHPFVVAYAVTKVLWRRMTTESSLSH